MTSTNASAPIDTNDTNAMLRRILAATEKDGSRGALELALAIILSLATLASTWCGYQANNWGGLQSSSQGAADTAERQAAEETIVGLQMRTFDAIVLDAYWAALRQKDTETQNAIVIRMRPQLRAAVEAALAAGVLHDPTQPGPLHRPEYVLDEETSAKQRRADAAKLNKIALSAGKTSGTYVLLTLMFASVLFFGGITATFGARTVRVGLTCVALVVFVFTIVLLVGLPISTG